MAAIYHACRWGYGEIKFALFRAYGAVGLLLPICPERSRGAAVHIIQYLYAYDD